MDQKNNPDTPLSYLTKGEHINSPIGLITFYQSTTQFLSLFKSSVVSDENA